MGGFRNRTDMSLYRGVSCILHPHKAPQGCSIVAHNREATFLRHVCHLSDFEEKSDLYCGAVRIALMPAGSGAIRFCKLNQPLPNLRMRHTSFKSAGALPGQPVSVERQLWYVYPLRSLVTPRQTATSVKRSFKTNSAVACDCFVAALKQSQQLLLIETT